MKVRAQTLRDYLSVHSWVGIFCGLLLFIAFYAGAFSMLKPEIRRWAQPQSHAAGISQDADRALAQFLHDHPDAKGRLSLRLPDDERATPLLRLGGRGDAQWFELRDDGTLQEAQQTQGSDNAGNFVDHLHRKGGLPLPLRWAEPVIGIVSLLYGLALVSGVVVLLPSLVKDLFFLRIGKNIKRMWLDVHNLLGIASLPFHVVIALSAAVFGLHDWIYDAQDQFIYKDGLKATVQRDSIPNPTVPREQWLQPSELIERMRAQAPNFTPQSLDYNGLGEARTTLFVAGTDDTHFKRGPQYGYAMVHLGTGEIYNRVYLPGSNDSALSTALNSFFSLHFGSYGGDPMRVVYVLLGLSGALLFYTGNLLWIETRTKRMRKTLEVQERPRHVRLLSNATLGVCLGCAAALPATIVASRWSMPWVDDMNAVHQGTFYLLFSGFIALAMVRGAARTGAGLLWTTALCNALVPLTALALHFVASPTWLAALHKTHQPGDLFLESLCLLLAVFFGWLAWRQQHRPVAQPWAHPPASGADSPPGFTSPQLQIQQD